MINMINKIERISNETRDLVNQFFIDNWFSTDMSIRGEIIDGKRVPMLFDDYDIK